MHFAAATALLSLVCFGAPACVLGGSQAQGQTGLAPHEQRQSPAPYSVLGLVAVPAAREPGTRLPRELPGAQGSRASSEEERARGGGAGRGGRRRLREQKRRGSRGRRTSAVVAGLHGSVVDSGYYAVTVYLGSPPQRFTLIADTGSSITYVPCSSCQHCGKQHQDPWFDPSKSSTCQAVSCSSPECVTHSCTSNSTGRSRSGRRLSLDYSVRPGGGMALGAEGARKEERLCMYAGTYAESSSTQGVLMADSISFVGHLESAGEVSPGQALPATGPGGSGSEGGLGRSRFVFGCEMEETGELFLQRADGILGLGRDALSLPTQLLASGSFGASDTFSLCFAAPHPVFGSPPRRPACSVGTPEQAGGGGGPEQSSGEGASRAQGAEPDMGRGGELILGAVEEVPGTVWVAWDPLSGHLPYYVVPVVGMRLGAVPLQVPEHVWSSGPYGGAMLDSGTTFTYLPSPAFREFSRVLQQHLHQLPLVPGPDPRFKDICYLAEPRGQAPAQGASGGAGPVQGPCAGEAEARSARQQQGHEWRQALGSIFPTATLVLGEGQEVVLAPFNYLFQHKGRRGAYCLGVFENPDGGVLLGGILVRGMRVTYDRLQRRVGFAPHNCSTPPNAARATANPRTGVPAPKAGMAIAGDSARIPSGSGVVQGAHQVQPPPSVRAQGAVGALPRAEEGPVLLWAQGAVPSLAAGSTDELQRRPAPEPGWGSAWWRALARWAHPVGTTSGVSELVVTGEKVPAAASSQELGASAVPARPLGAGAEGVQSFSDLPSEALLEAASRGRPHYSFLELPLPVRGRRNEASREAALGLLDAPSPALKRGLYRGASLEANSRSHSQSLMEAPALHILALILASPIVLLFAMLKPFHFVGRQLFNAWRPGLLPQPYPQALQQQQPCAAATFPASPSAAWTPQVSQSRFLRTPPRPTLGTSPRPPLSKKTLTLSEG